jgi:SPP1 gp7 family putative phage head morphogenesis protein
MIDELADVCAVMRLQFEAQIERIAGQKSFGNVDPSKLDRLHVKPLTLRRMRKVTRQNLKASLEENYEIARRELPARKFRRIGPGMDKLGAENFLTNKALHGATKIEKDAIEQVRQVLENAIKYDKSLAATIAALDEINEALSLLPEYEVITRGGKEIVRAINAPHRLEVIARTNIAEAVNQARMALFNDPELKGFVRAFEYSAILDSRTTDICEHLNGKILRDFSVHAPPNHYQCRSVLVPVTVVDDWNGKESPKPRLEPQKGFG